MKKIALFMAITLSAEILISCDSLLSVMGGVATSVQSYLDNRNTTAGGLSGINTSNPTISTGNKPKSVAASSNTVNARRKELGPGGFVIISGSENGIHTETRYGSCPNCRGTQICNLCKGSKLCGFCEGKGHSVGIGTGIVRPCMACNQSGKCHYCGGTGKCECTKKSAYPGYAIYEIKTLDGNGNVIDDDVADYGNKSKSSSSNSSSSKTSSSKSCPKCSGRKFETQPYDYAPASTTGWMQPYHNHSGTKCSYCNRTDDHYHHPCSECRGFGHI